MAIRFKDWPLAFKELQIASKISPVIEIPPILHNQLKPNYHNFNLADQSTLPLAPPSDHSTPPPFPPSPSLPDLTRKKPPPTNFTPTTTTSTPIHIPQTKNSFKNKKNNSSKLTSHCPANSPTNSITSNQSYPHSQN